MFYINNRLIWLAIIVAIALAEVTILKTRQTVYNRSPKIRIKGAGIDMPEDDIRLDIGAINQPSLTPDKDFIITKDDDGDGLILKLLSNRKWVDLLGRTPPVALVLRKFTTKNSDKNLLPGGEEVIIANVLETPSVDENDEVLYAMASNELRVNGTGFAGAKKVDFYFKPPLVKEVAYEVVSKFPVSKNEVVLRLRHGYSWREEGAGALSIVGVDTGGGPVKLNGEDGVQVAYVKDNLPEHAITVEAADEDQLLYHDDPNLLITGSGFNPLGTSLRFANGITSKANYSFVSTTSNEISLRLQPGSSWRANMENLPGVLTLLAVNAGEGFVSVGPINAQKGRDVATIFERPRIFSSNTKLYKTHSHELHIKGAGFPRIKSKPALKFNPELTLDEDYTLKVVDRTDLEITLLDGKRWRDDSGPLQVVAINTRGDAAGWIQLDGELGVHVAEIMDDIDSKSTGGVEVFPMGYKVYQSKLQEQIVISGSGFSSGMTFTFEPKLKSGDFSMSIEGENKAVITLKDGKKWRDDPGFIIVKSVDVNGKSYSLAGSDGIRVAVVLADPTVKAGSDSFHETQSKVVAIKGSGFTNVADTKVIIRPTAPGAYRVLAVLEDTIRVQLKQGFDWLPGFLSLSDGDDAKKVPLQVTGIDTGAGEVVFDEPITVGFVVKDREGVVCDDSCEFAFDDVCDDGTESEYYEYYEYYGYYMDDDAGGYYDGYAAYDDYYMEDDSYKVSACVEGTDCTDCGGVDAIVDYSKAPDADSGIEVCTNTCPYARDGVCDDPRGANYCKLGTDCQDCGPVGADNFTKADDDGWWDDDDDYWTFNDGNFLDQTKGLEANRHRVKVYTRADSTGPAAMFLVVLEGMVYTVGAIFAAIALYLGLRWYRGASIPFVKAFNPETSAPSDVELSRRPSKKMPITPDAFRT
jgi:hypothetical protein